MEAVWQRINPEAMEGACAAIYKDVLYLALPLDGAEQNSHVVEYRLQEGTYSLISLAGVRDWLVLREAQGERLLCLIGAQVYEYGRGEAFGDACIQAHWFSPWVTMNTLAAKRTVGKLCMTVEAHSTGGDVPEMVLSVIGGERMRSKRIRLNEGINLLRERIRLRARQFRIGIENVDGCRLVLPDGMEIILEEDSDL